MTRPLFLTDLPADLDVGGVVEVRGSEGRHAAVVKRIGVDEQIMVGDGQGRVVAGPVTRTDKTGLELRIVEMWDQPAEPRPVTVVQALAKGDRAELAVEMMTEVGVSRIRPWQSSRAIVRWQGERGQKSLAKWRNTAREATKQSRRTRIPEITEVVTTAQLCAEWAETPVAERPVVLTLHEDAECGLGEIDLPAAGEVVFVVGPEGGLTEAELAAFAEIGARPVQISDAVLRTSTAGALAVGMVRG